MQFESILVNDTRVEEVDDCMEEPIKEASSEEVTPLALREVKREEGGCRLTPTRRTELLVELMEVVVAVVTAS